jgi:hypothetical protein
MNMVDEGRECHYVIYSYLQIKVRDLHSAAQWEKLYNKDSHKFKLKCNTVTATWQAGQLV